MTNRPITDYFPTRPTPPTSGFAVASLVLSLVGVSFLAVIFGHVALGDVKRNRKDGHGMAVAGLVIGYLGVILWIIAISAVIAAARSLPDVPPPDLGDYCAAFPQDC